LGHAAACRAKGGRLLDLMVKGPFRETTPTLNFATSCADARCGYQPPRALEIDPPWGRVDSLPALTPETAGPVHSH
jgi:hypothetical protein